MNMKKINVLKPKFRTKEILSEIEECLEKGWTGMGFKTEQFEEAWKEYTNLPHAHFISSNTVGLHLALNIFKKKYGWSEGDEIITTPLTFVSTNHAIKYENLTPVFADVDEYLCIDKNDFESKITPKTKALIYVGIGGNCGDLKSIKQICDKHNIKLILDAAHMAGTFIKKIYSGVAFTDEHVGQDADVTVFSFQAVKNLPTADSGMICFKDSLDDKIARKLTWLGIDKDTYSRSNEGSYKWKYNVDELGFKYHGNSIMASIGLVQLKYLENDNSRRREIAKQYDSELKNTLGISIIKDSPYVYASSKHLYQIRILSKDRDYVVNKLCENNIYPGVHYIDNTEYDLYKKYNGNCPNASKYSKELLTLPIHLDLSTEDITLITDTLKNILNE